MTDKKQTKKTARVPYDASPTELATIAEIKNHLHAAYGRVPTITTQDALTFSVLVACEVLELSERYAMAMPHPVVASETRLARHMKHPVHG